MGWDAPLGSLHVSQHRSRSDPRDGIGQEVVAQGLKVLNAVLPQDVKLETKEYDLGAQRWHRTGDTLPDAELEALKNHDAILLGAIGDPSVPSGVLERGLLLKLRFAFDHFINLQPLQALPEHRDPARRPPLTSTSSSSARAPRARTPATAARCAPAPPPRSPPRSASTRPTASSAWSGTPSSARRPAPQEADAGPQEQRPRHAGHLWKNTFDRVAAEYPQVSTDHLHVDAATIFFVTQPERFDVIVTDNLFGDISPILAAAVTGGIGLAASGNINPTVRSRRCSSRSTAPPPTSPGRARPTDRHDPLRRPPAAPPRLRHRERRAHRGRRLRRSRGARQGHCAYDRRDR